MAATPRLHRRINDHPLYLWAAILIPILVLAGFARTYYLKGIFATPALPSLIVHVHGIVMTTWVLLFVTQIALVANHRVRLHQKLGIAGTFLAVLLIILGVLTALYAAARGSTFGPPPLQFLIVPLGDMLVFSILFGLALYFRSRPDMHKRLMLLATMTFLPPAIARIPFSFIQNGGPLAFFGLTDLCIFGFIAYDTIKHRRLHPVFLGGAVFVFALQVLRLVLASSTLWLQIAGAMVNLVK
jgi:hypothetical protein